MDNDQISQALQVVNLSELAKRSGVSRRTLTRMKFASDLNVFQKTMLKLVELELVRQARKSR